jgi:hypothetical protein
MVMRRPDDLDTAPRHALLVTLLVDLPLAVDLDLQVLAERVDARDADAVQAAGHLVAALVEFPAGVQLGHHHVERVHRLGRMGTHGDAAPVVLDGQGPVRVDDQLDRGRVAGERLVDGVVHHLVDQVVQPLGAGAADVHVRALAHRLEALEDLDAVGRVFAACGRAVGGAARLRGPLLTSCFQPSTSEFGGSWAPLERARRRREGRLGSITRDRAASRRTDACKSLEFK